MTEDEVKKTVPTPCAIIAERLSAAYAAESKVQTAYAAIGALEQNGWVIVRKRHMRIRP